MRPHLKGLIRVFLRSWYLYPCTDFLTFFFREYESFQKLAVASEIEAKKSSNGVVWKEEDCFSNVAEAKANDKELGKRKDQLEGQYGNTGTVRM